MVKETTTERAMPHLYKNEFRWRIMPPAKAEADGYFDRSFSNKAKALKYQKPIKSRFPDEPCALVDTGRYYDYFGRIYQSRN